MLGDTANKRAVRILLECILVCICFCVTKDKMLNFDVDVNVTCERTFIQTGDPPNLTMNLVALNLATFQFYGVFWNFGMNRSRGSKGITLPPEGNPGSATGNGWVHSQQWIVYFLFTFIAKSVGHYHKIYFQQPVYWITWQNKKCQKMQ